ncbi:unnamed protein product [Acanthosepion pharaonis]|uniref:Uncharacterized protein n=1 Tax=Acanthosepion pharaonis TaxID=158019 RepID=A0A812D7P0_ACAPH|nr:unnamed protein product [Sepia pharaonis]
MLAVWLAHARFFFLTSSPSLNIFHGLPTRSPFISVLLIQPKSPPLALILNHNCRVSLFRPTSRSFSTSISHEPHPLFSGTGLPLNKTFLSIYLSIYLSISLSVSLSLILSLSLSLSLSLCLSRYLSISISIYLFIYLSVCLSLFLYLTFSISLFFSL